MTQRGRAAGRAMPQKRGGPPAGARDGRARPPAGDLAARRTRVREVVEPVVGAAGYDLEDLALSRAGRRTLVRVTVDRDGGMGLDAIAEVSRAVSAALDKAEEDGGELLPGEYELEVSSRGVDRPLTLPRHWRRNTGRLVKVTAAGRQLTGRVTTVDDGGVVIDVDGTAHEVGFADLGPGRVQVEFTRLDEVGEADPEDEDDEDDDFDDEAALDDDELEDEER